MTKTLDLHNKKGDGVPATTLLDVYNQQSDQEKAEIKEGCAAMVKQVNIKRKTLGAT